MRPLFSIWTALVLTVFLCYIDKKDATHGIAFDKVR